MPTLPPAMVLAMHLERTPPERETALPPEEIAFRWVALEGGVRLGHADFAAADDPTFVARAGAASHRLLCRHPASSLALQCHAVYRYPDGYPARAWRAVGPSTWPPDHADLRGALDRYARCILSEAQLLTLTPEAQSACA